MAIYTTNLPVSSNPPRVDQPSMTQNSQYLAAFGNKDHNFSLDSTNVSDGYHNVTHFVNQSIDPGVLPVGQLYTKTANGHICLFFENEAGTIIELTNTSNSTIMRASVVFDPGVLGTLFSKLNVNSPITLAGSVYTISFTSPLPSANYLWTVSATEFGSTANNAIICKVLGVTANNFSFQTVNQNNSNVGPGLIDRITFMAFGG